MPLPVRRAAPLRLMSPVSALPPLPPCASHSGTCVAVCLQPTTTTPTPHCPNTQFLTPGRRGTTTAAAAAGGGGCHGPGRCCPRSLSLSLCGGWWHAVASIVSTRRVSAPALSPPLPRVSVCLVRPVWFCALPSPAWGARREAACAVNNPHAALRWGAHTELLEASVRCRWVRTFCVCTAAAVRAGEPRRGLESPLPLSSTSRSLSPSLPPSLSLSLSCRQLSRPLAMSMTVLEGQEHQHAPASSTGGTLIAQRCWECCSKARAHP